MYTMQQYLPLLKEFAKSHQSNKDVTQFLENLISYVQIEPNDPKERMGQYCDKLIAMLVKEIKEEKYSEIYCNRNDKLDYDFMYCEEGHKSLQEVLSAILNSLALTMVTTFNKSIDKELLDPTGFQKKFLTDDFTNPFSKNKLDHNFIFAIFGILAEINIGLSAKKTYPNSSSFYHGEQSNKKSSLDNNSQSSSNQSRFSPSYSPSFDEVE